MEGFIRIFLRSLISSMGRFFGKIAGFILVALLVGWIVSCMMSLDVKADTYEPFIEVVIATDSDSMARSSHTVYTTSSPQVSDTQAKWFYSIWSDMYPDKQYVMFRVGQYQYGMWVADKFTYNNGSFSASSTNYVTYNTQSYTFGTGTESSFVLSNASYYIVYTNVPGTPFPDVETYVNGGVKRDTQILKYAVVVGFVFVLVARIFDYAERRRVW